jgi:hypothetical protein
VSSTKSVKLAVEAVCGEVNSLNIENTFIRRNKER